MLFKYPEIGQLHQHLLSSCTFDSKTSHSRHLIPRLRSTAERLWRLFVFFPGYGLPWTITFPASKDDRLEATALANGSPALATTGGYREFIASRTDVLHHPLVWVRLVQYAHEIGAFAAHEDSRKISASFCRVLLPAVWGTTPPGYTSSSDMMPMHVALRFHSAKEICLYLLGMLTNFDVLESSLNRRVVAAALEFALAHVSAGPSNSNEAHWDIIDYVLTQMNDPAEMDPKGAATFSDFMGDYILRLIKNTGVCDHPLQSEKLVMRRDGVLKVYWAIMMKQVYSGNTARSGTQSTFALLGRATQGTLRQLQMAINRTHLSKPLASNANRVFDILSIALGAGSVEAFETVIELDCLELFTKHHQPSQNVSLISGYVAGLRSRSLDSAREVYISHLYEPQNLRYAILSAFEWWPYVHTEDARVTDLFQLRPDDLVWDECRRWLRYVSEWAIHSDLTPDSFFARRLGEEWECHVLRAYLTEAENHESNSNDIGNNMYDLATGDLYSEAVWSGISKLQGAMRSIDTLLAEKTGAESLVIPLSPTISKTEKGLSRESSWSKPLAEDEALPSTEVPSSQLLRWKAWIFSRLARPTARDPTLLEYV
ncbi:hypothetical protein D9757_005141 [Collybiopsis confluens]|uniref:Uncharacterized protein n=1 Tax=Collybiopsis confluens TaxID=2823264 RepID=A0A8H5MCK5_9AGAR|nr:hypothetical protein D9757_005141 [Collybiopsis confluens]